MNPTITRYGVNFGLPPIPVELRRGLPRFVKSASCPYPHHMVGLCFSDATLTAMLQIANNGSRDLLTHRHKDGRIAIYAY